MGKIGKKTEFQVSTDSKQGIGYNIAFRDVYKVFGSLIANDNVSFDVKPGQVHALLGENGAGKSTLMNILTGMLQPDKGHIELDGVPCAFRNTHDSRIAGIGMVHQQFSLIPSLSIEENFALEDPLIGGVYNRTKYHDRIREYSRDFGIKVDPSKPVWQLGHAKKQWLEVFRVLYMGGHTLIFDEPTSALSPPEGDAMLEKIRALSLEGKTIVLITHKMREILSFADQVTVLMRGKFIKTVNARSVDSDYLTELMVGKSDDSNGSRQIASTSDMKSNAPVLSVQNLTCRGSRNTIALDKVNFTLHAGKILGVAGIAGNGQEELAQALSGMLKPIDGSITIRNDSSVGDVRDRLRYIPADRLRTGVIGPMSVEENMVLRDFFHKPITKRRYLLDRTELSRVAQDRLTDYRVKYPSLTSPLSQLSGGNIQRVLLARELSGEFRVLVAHNPVAGLDFAGTSFVHNTIRNAAKKGAAIVLISNEMDELLDLSDKILVLHQGSPVGIYNTRELDRQRLGGLMLGQYK